MNGPLKACLVALAATTTIDPPVAAQPPVLRVGVSVEMPVTRNAVAMPDADNQDSLILAVTAKGNVYFGIIPISPADLAEKVKGGLSPRTEKKLYIKGDSRTSYTNIAMVLEAVRKAGIDAPNLLTAQRDSPEPGYPVPPKGLEVLVGPSLPSASESIVVRVLKAEQRPTLIVNNERISFDALPATLRQCFQNRSQRIVVAEADERLPFGDAVRVIDTCRSVGAKVFLATAGAGRTSAE